jgi:hypothetical protein
MRDKCHSNSEKVMDLVDGDDRVRRKEFSQPFGANMDLHFEDEVGVTHD